MVLTPFRLVPIQGAKLLEFRTNDMIHGADLLEVYNIPSTGKQLVAMTMYNGVIGVFYSMWCRPTH